MRTWLVMRRPLATSLALGLLLAGCAGGGTPVDVTAEPTQEIATEVDEALLQPLTQLGPCEDGPEPGVDVADVPGLYLPDGGVVTNVTEQGPLTNADGWIPMTPIQIRVAMVNHPDVTVLNVEDEVWESETLATDGDNRLFLKAQAICESASVFVAIVSPEDGSAPAPLGQGS